MDGGQLVAALILATLALGVAGIGVTCVVHGLRQVARARALARAPRRHVRVLDLHRDLGPRRPVYRVEWDEGDAEIVGPLPGAPRLGDRIEVAVEDGAPVVPARIARDAWRLVLGGAALGVLSLAGAVAWLLRVVG